MAAESNAGSDQQTRGGADRCPYSRSFTADSALNPRCPAYQAATFTVLDTSNRPLGSALTCRHLTVGNDARRVGRFYPRCGLGDADERLRWVATVTPGRLAVMRSLEEEFDELTRADRGALLEAKARLLAGRSADGPATDALEMQLSVFLDRVEDFISERSDRLADVGLRASQLRQLLADWSLAWLRGHRLFGPTMPDMRTGRFAPAAGALLGADVRGGPQDDERSGELIAEAGTLVIERDTEAGGLSLRGEIDVNNSDAIATAVAAALAGGGDVAVDFGEVLFCDLSGLRALVRAAASAPEGRRITVTGLPAHLQRAVRLVGWAELPALVITDPPHTDAGSQPEARQ
jgi:anti-anti-sigma regulatory factor